MAPRGELRLVDPSSTFADLPDVMTVEEAARVLRIGRGAAYALARQYLDSDVGRACPWCDWGAACGCPGPGCSDSSTSPVRPVEPPAAERGSVDDAQAQGRPALLITGPAGDLSRAVGTTAWAVLADVALDAEVDEKGWRVADTNVRRIATHLGISKDCAARALVRLAGAGPLLRRRPRRSTGGRFAPSAYELHLDPNAGVVLAASAPASPCSVGEDRERRSSSASPSPALEDGRSDVAAFRAPRRRHTSRVDQKPLFDLASESSRRR